MILLTPVIVHLSTRISHQDLPLFLVWAFGEKFTTAETLKDYIYRWNGHHPNEELDIDCRDRALYQTVLALWNERKRYAKLEAVKKAVQVLQERG